LLERLGASSAITLPLHYRGKVVGIANLLRGSDSAPYDARDLAFAESLADHAAVAIANVRVHEAERAAHRSAELATVAREQAEARFACLSESGVLGIVVADLDGHIVEVNERDDLGRGGRSEAA
jgi:GAF domain-containing protein